jgi:hypothetical protein
MNERDAAAQGRALDTAMSAARRVWNGESEHVHATEERIFQSLRGTNRTRRIFWIAPLAAAFVVSGAFAQGLGGRLAQLKAHLFAEDAAEVPASVRAAAPNREPSPPRAEVPPAAASAAPPPSPEATTPTPDRGGPSSNVPRPAPAVLRTVPAPRSSASAAATDAALELTLYKEAHHAHFAARDFAAALAGWNRYLAVAPRGTFALEARYNRAIAWYRLGRRAEAVEALRPFADGTYGRYRRDEARDLLEKLR